MKLKDIKNEPISILIIDDQPIVLHGIKMFLDAEREFAVCGTAQECDEALEAATQLKPDLITLDLQLGNRDGPEMIKNLKQASPRSHVVVLSGLDENVHALRCLRACARAYLMKDESPETLLNALTAVAKGGIYASPPIKDTYFEAFVTNQPPAGLSELDCLSNGELRVFRMIGLGMTTGTVAKELGLSSKTISAYRERIKNKLGISNAKDLEWRARQDFGQTENPDSGTA